jgi:hypothetical protein
MDRMRLAARALIVALAASALTLPSGAQTSPPAPSEPAPSAPPSAPADADKSAGKAPGPVGGYSWSDKPKKGRAARRALPKLDPKAPLATYPGFRMLPGGGSTVWVMVSKKVSVDVRRARGRVSYVLSRAQVGIWNNTNPLITHYFDTPLSRAWLRPEKGGAELVLELRENVEPKHRVVDGPGGTMILHVELPRASKRHTAQQVMPPDAKKGQVFVPSEPSRRRKGAPHGASGPRP